MLDGPPDRQRPGLTRTWGDGGGDKRRHVIEDIDVTYGAITCRCGAWVSSADDPSLLEQVWDLHRGRATATWGIAPANDFEVAQFLRKLDRDLVQVSGLADVMDSPAEAPPLASSADFIAALLDRYETMKATCSCATTPVEQCPNYVEGDELAFED